MDKIKKLISEDEINKKIDELATIINKDYAGKALHIVCILSGGVFFMCELAKKLSVPVTIDFIKAVSYEDKSFSSGKIKITKNLEHPIEGRHVLIVEDIIDTGHTLKYINELLKKSNPASLEICTLLDKPDRRETEVFVKYNGFKIPNLFVVGMGLDYAQSHRNLPYIGVIETND